MSELTKLYIGDVVCDRLEVINSINENDLGMAYLMSDRNSGGKYLVTQLGWECTPEIAAEISSLVTALKPIDHKSIAKLKEFILDGTTGYLLTEFVDGEPLFAHLAARRERGQILGLKAAYSFLAHLCLGIEVAHQANHVFGSISPETIYVTNEGRVRLSNIIFPIIADKYLDDASRNDYFGNVFVAPEVRAERKAATPASDVFSMAMLFAELVSSTPLIQFQGSPEAFIAQLSGVSTKVKEALFQAAKPDIEDRFQTIQEFKDTLKNAVDAPNDNDLSSIVVGVNDLRALSNPVSQESPSIAMRRPDLFNTISRPTARVTRTDVWIYQKDGMDYGPFDADGLLKKFYDDEIDETTSIFNTSTKKRQNLGTIPEFEDKVREYLPIRNQNREVRQKAERKAAAVKTASGIGAVIAIAGGIIAVFTVPIIILMLMPDPEPLDLDTGFTVFEKKFEVPKTEEVALNVDESKSKALFDPKATEAEREAALKAWEEEHRKKYAARRSAAGVAAPGEEMDTLVFGLDENGKELEPLMDWEIEEQCMSPRILKKVRDCYTQYAGGRQPSATVNFTIQQSGAVRSVSVSNVSGELNSCIVSAFSTLKYRPFGGTSKKVSIPIG
ncbi:MAG: protein kinase [Proteobacteria bacterium]|nr:protein kinase [Pseudomonadota bacterium]